MKARCIVHKWGHWSEPVNVDLVNHGTAELPRTVPVHMTRSMQMRSCDRCGKAQISYSQPIPPDAKQAKP